MLGEKVIVPREPTFELDMFDEPMEVTGPDAWIRDVVAMAFYEPGTFVADPLAGAYINNEVYNFANESPGIIKNKLQNSCNTYLSDVPIENLDVSSYYWEEMDVYVIVVSVAFRYQGKLKSYNAYITTIDYQLRYVVSQIS